jgi:guanylate kinase
VQADDTTRDTPRPTGEGRDLGARLTVLAGPTAVGKGTVSADVRARYPEVWLSVSVTTRRPRPGEIDGVHYHFVDDATFDSMVAGGEFLEWALVHGRNRYGTPRAAVLERLATGTPALLEIDLAGARQVREAMPDARFVFLAPPSWDELVRRLVGRGTEDEEERERRLATARVELAAESEFDHVIVNDEVHRATDELIQVMGVRTRATSSIGH